MNRWNVTAAVFFLACLLSGCGNSVIQAEPYLQDLERALTLKEQVSRNYLDALAAAKTYAEEPSENALQQAKDICLSSIDAITETEAIESALTSEQRESMSELGIDQADYMTPFLMQTYENGTRLQNLTDILDYLDQAPVNNDALALTANVNIAFEELSWQIDLIGLNHLLAQVPENQLQDFKNNFLANLSVLAGGPIPWQTDRAILEEQSEAIFGQMEDLIGEHAKQIGELYTSVLDEKKRLEADASGQDEAVKPERKANAQETQSPNG